MTISVMVAESVTLSSARSVPSASSGSDHWLSAARVAITGVRSWAWTLGAISPAHTSRTALNSGQQTRRQQHEKDDV
ncbi:hypothetical protein GCM10007160_08170 [Litchfieldella qijiaojingensis]|uniref:Uncharacterized protein n=1 Tax=Litchfieldella qijiaojingensis TaxID=980347 RepID=A0ABQ2YIB6_9GAMM|nr:hypothetical protein GCM10007160_08170 [Halomonas qijiaojingensis]